MPGPIEKEIPIKFELAHLNIELTNKCQLRCKWCGDRKTRERGDMPLEGVAYILNQVKQPVQVRFFCSGDPLLYEKLPEALTMALMRGNTVLIHTNGVGMTKELADRIIAVSLGFPHRIELSFSIDGRDEKEYEKIRGPHLQTVLKNAEYFIKRNDTFGSPVMAKIQCIVPFMTKMKAPAYLKPLSSFNTQLNMRYPHDWDRRGSVEEAHPEETYKPPCGFLCDSFVVYWNGDVPICCADLNGDRVIGNIFKDGMQTCIIGINYARILQEKGLNCPICEGCNRYEQPKETDNKPPCG
jgi:sulfatase maturation enzyme AslB (radical SAM superfamily)